MQYREWYYIHYKYEHPVGGDDNGSFGPFETEADALFQMGRIEKRHDSVKGIYWAQMVRVTEVTLATYSRARSKS